MPTPAAIKVTAFLRMRAASCVTRDGQRGVVLKLRDTGELFPDGFAAQWLGNEATEFLRQHQDELAPGRCLELEIYYLRSVQAELRARVKSCALAPLAPSWVKHAEHANPSNQEQHTT